MLDPVLVLERLHVVRTTTSTITSASTSSTTTTTATTRCSSCGDLAEAFYFRTTPMESLTKMGLARFLERKEGHDRTRAVTWDKATLMAAIADLATDIGANPEAVHRPPVRKRHSLSL